MSDDQLPGADLCQNCGYMLALHVTANLSDGAFVGQYLIICPTALFLSTADPSHTLPALPKMKEPQP
jgi:hypothetical protein